MARKRASAPVDPSVRTYRLWTPGQLRTAERLAESGRIRLAVDVCDWVLADEKVQAALDGRINSMLSAPVSFDKSGDRRRSSVMVKALDAGEDWWAIVRQPEVRLMLRWGIVLGLGPAVHDWSIMRDHGSRDIPVLRFFHPQPLFYDQPKRQWFYQPDIGAPVPFEWGDGIWVGHRPGGNARPWNGLWRALARWVLLKSYAISDWGRLGETAVRNVVEIDKEAKSTYKERVDLAAEISEMARDGSLVLPPGFHYKTVETPATASQICLDQIKMADNAIAIAIRGGNLTMDNKGGSLAAAEVQERTGEQANKEADAEAWSETAREQTLKPWAMSNYGDTNLAPWPLYDVAPPEDQAAKATTFNTAIVGAQAAVNLGFTIDQRVFAEQFGFADWLLPGTLEKSTLAAERPAAVKDKSTDAST